MSTRARVVPGLVAAGAVLALLGAGLWILVDPGSRAGSGDEVVVRPTPAAAEPARPAPAELVPPPEVRTPEAVLDDTTVLWPVRVELDLVAADYRTPGEEAPPIGTGRSAELSGRLSDDRGEGIQGEVRFVAGPNTGEVLRCDGDGRFGSKFLYPGLSVVEVRKGERVLSRREVRLRQEMSTLLNIPYGRPGSVEGRVVDAKGEGVGGARVAYDGQTTYANADGEFYLPRVAAGEVLVEIDADGFARFRQLVNVTGGTSLPRDLMPVYVLREPCTLTIDADSDVGGPGPIVVYLSSALDRASNEERSFPWYEVGPIEVWPGTRATVEGLPPGDVRLHSFRPGARLPTKRVNLRPGHENQVLLTLEPAPVLHGRVLAADGSPAAGAFVRLEAPDRTRAMLDYFGQASWTFLEGAVQPVFPPALQETRADDQGRFRFTAYEDVAGTRFLEAQAADFRSWAGTAVRKGQREVELELRAMELGDSSIELDFVDRWQGLPIELVLNGEPHDPVVLPPFEPFRIDRLLAGRWTIAVSWHAEGVLPEEAFTLRGVWSRSVRLPQEAVDGQDEETWRRAGKEFPFGN